MYFLLLFILTSKPEISLVALTTKEVQKTIKLDNTKEDEGAKNKLESCRATKKAKIITPFSFKGVAHPCIENLYIIQLFR